jgi:hypothetical protein
LNKLRTNQESLSFGTILYKAPSTDRKKYRYRTCEDNTMYRTKHREFVREIFMKVAEVRVEKLPPITV